MTPLPEPPPPPDALPKAVADEGRWQRLHPLPIFGTGEHTRTLTHVDDIADGIVAAMSSASRRDRRNHVVPRSNWPLVLMSIADCTASSTLLSSASMARHSGTRPKTSRARR